jgi:hypothetical protein
VEAGREATFGGRAPPRRRARGNVQSSTFGLRPATPGPPLRDREAQEYSGPLLQPVPVLSCVAPSGPRSQVPRRTTTFAPRPPLTRLRTIKGKARAGWRRSLEAAEGELKLERRNTVQGYALLIEEWCPHRAGAPPLRFGYGRPSERPPSVLKEQSRRCRRLLPVAAKRQSRPALPARRPQRERRVFETRSHPDECSSAGASPVRVWPTAQMRGKRPSRHAERRPGNGRGQSR